MKTVKYVPKSCLGDDKKFEGSLTMRLPTFDQKYELLEISGIKFSDAGEVESSSSKDRLDMIRKLVKHSESFYETVSLIKCSSLEEFKSFEDMQYDDDAHAILIEVGLALLNGFKLGN